MARGLPAPVADHGGWRVDTGLPEEEARWVFAAPCDGLAELGRTIDRPRCLLKLCAPAAVLMAQLPPRWRIELESWFMGGPTPPVQPLRSGYRLQCDGDAGVYHARIFTEEGALAASGHAAQTADAFVYDRIRTQPEHRRLGLGRAVMAALGRCRTRDVPQLLTATADGRALYASLGWSVLSPYVTAGLPDTVDR